MAKRKPQINFQVDEHMKLLYDESRASGHFVTRFCAAGFLLMVENPEIRMQALNRLREWEEEFDGADEGQIREFVQGAQRAIGSQSPGSSRGRGSRAAKKKARR